MAKVIVLMSGGVDSSVSALLLKQQGYELIGLYLNYTPYCNPQDELDARQIAQILNIPFYSLDITQEFEEKIIDYFVKTYEKGLTPNPDVFCNKLIKFGIIFEKGLSLGADFLATGHYARIVLDNKGYHLLAGLDKNKDQSYFLWGLEKNKLSKIIFPVGNLTKEEVRKIALENSFPNALKKGSSGICFVGPVKLREFLSKYLTPKEGLIIDTKGKILGTHPGYFYFTEGQRHGLNIKTGGGPYYVVKKIPEENLVIVAQKGDPALYTSEIKITDLNILEEDVLKERDVVLARFRYRQPLVKVKVNLKENTVTFIEPQLMIAPGQSIVFYENDMVLGGAVISQKIR